MQRRWEHPKLIISIHAPRTGSDLICRSDLPTISDFNPRSPHGERLLALRRFAFNPRFQSTLPARGATFCSSNAVAAVIFQSTLPARGATASSSPTGWKPTNFNPRSPHGERLRRSSDKCARIVFQSTLPARGATCAGRKRDVLPLISIHAPRTGSDSAK